VFNFVQVQGQFHITVELDSRQAARKGDPAGMWESQREDLALSLHCVQPQEYIEYFEDSADSCASRLEKRHFVRNLSLTR
jgi:hypothetical protein